MSKLDGKVAVVTGASKGIGAGIAAALARAGAAVAVNYASDRAGADAVVEAIAAAGGRAVAVKGDVSDAAQAGALVEEAVRAFGRLDILVNNSGVYDFASLEHLTPEHYRRIFDVNVLGLLLVSQAAARHLGDGGTIVNVSSVVTTLFPPNSAVYTGSKGAVDAITGVLAKELAPRGIRVNVVSPGPIDTAMFAAASEELRSGVASMVPLGRMGRAEEVAAAALFLASDESSFVAGAELCVDGGMAQV